MRVDFSKEEIKTKALILLPYIYWFNFGIRQIASGIKLGTIESFAY